MKTILHISTILLTALFLLGCTESNNDKATPPECRARIKLQLLDNSDEQQKPVEHFESHLEKNFDASLRESIRKNNLSFSNEKVQHKMQEIDRGRNFIQFTLSSFEICNCAQLLDTLMSVLSINYQALQMERIKKEHDQINLNLNKIELKLDTAYTRFSDLEKLRKKLKTDKFRDSLEMLETEYLNLLGQKGTWRIKIATQQPNRLFRILDNAVKIPVT